MSEAAEVTEGPITIEAETTEHGCRTFCVRVGERYADKLTFDEMLGLVASLTLPREWLKTQEQWDQWHQHFAGLTEAAVTGGTP